MHTHFFNDIRKKIRMACLAGSSNYSEGDENTGMGGRQWKQVRDVGWTRTWCRCKQGGGVSDEAGGVMGRGE